jgi:hypothetical protein
MNEFQYILLLIKLSLRWYATLDEEITSQESSESHYVNHSVQSQNKRGIPYPPV